MASVFYITDDMRYKSWQRDTIPLEELDLNFSKQPIRKLGIDIDAKYMDIKRIFFKRYLRQIIAIGEDPEDMLQEIFKGILIRNKGTCPFDPKKSAFSTYVTMVCHCVMTNHLKKYSKTRALETEISDTFERKLNSLPEENHEAEYREMISDFSALFEGDFREVFLLMAEGYKTREISGLTGLNSNEVRNRIKMIREAVSEKREEA